MDLSEYKRLKFMAIQNVLVGGNKSSTQRT